MTKAICPKNKTHKTFHTVAHVQELWEVDQNGEYNHTVESLETTVPPDTGNIWNCATCGAEAIFED